MLWTRHSRSRAHTTEGRKKEREMFSSDSGRRASGSHLDTGTRQQMDGNSGARPGSEAPAASLSPARRTLGRHRAPTPARVGDRRAQGSWPLRLRPAARPYARPSVGAARTPASVRDVPPRRDAARRPAGGARGRGGGSRRLQRGEGRGRRPR